MQALCLWYLVTCLTTCIASAEDVLDTTSLLQISRVTHSQRHDKAQLNNDHHSGRNSVAPSFAGDAGNEQSVRINQVGNSVAASSASVGADSAYDSAVLLTHASTMDALQKVRRHMDAAKKYCSLMSKVSSSYYPQDVMLEISHLFAKEGGSYMPQGNGFARLEHASYEEQMTNMSNFIGSFGYKNLSCRNIYMGQDPNKVIAEFHFSAWAEPNGIPMSSSKFNDVTDLVTLTFDDDGKIKQYDDWWDPYVSGKIKQAVTDASFLELAGKPWHAFGKAMSEGLEVG